MFKQARKHFDVSMILCVFNSCVSVWVGGRVNGQQEVTAVHDGEIEDQGGVAHQGPSRVALRSLGAAVVMACMVSVGILWKIWPTSPRSFSAVPQNRQGPHIALLGVKTSA